MDDLIVELRSVPSELMAECYGEMRALARRIMSGNTLSRVIQPTELANEAVIRLIRMKLDQNLDRGHILAIAARAMRQVLIDEARRAQSAKRRAPNLPTTWPGARRDELVDIDALDSALKALASFSPERAEVVELRFMLGMNGRRDGVRLRRLGAHGEAALAGRPGLVDGLSGDGGRCWSRLRSTSGRSISSSG